MKISLYHFKIKGVFAVAVRLSNKMCSWQISVCLSILMISCATHKPQTPGLQRFDHEFSAMGTEFNILLYHDSEAEALSIFEEAEIKAGQLNAIFSDYLEDSEISRLSRFAGLDTAIHVSMPLWEVLAYAQKLSELSDGAFDITIGPLSKLWRRAFRRKTFPDPELLTAASSKVGYASLILDEDQQSAQLLLSGMRLDAGGLAKGYTVDVLARLITDRHIKSFLVDGGGDIYAGNAPPGLTGWKIALQDSGKESRPEYLYLANEAVAASGTTYRYLEHEGRRYGHIIDPRTGMGISGMSIAYVRARRCMHADGLASVLAILGPEAFHALCEAVEDCTEVL